MTTARPWLQPLVRLRLGVAARHHAETTATIVGVRLNPVPPPDAAMEIPIVVAATTEASVRARPEIWATVAWHCLEIVRAHVLARKIDERTLLITGV